MENELATNPEPLSPEEAQAKAAILVACENLAAAGVTFVAVHFDGCGDSRVTEEVRCFDSEYYAYEEHKPVTYEAAYLQEHFEALVPLGYENDCGGFGDVILDVFARKIRVEGRTSDGSPRPKIGLPESAPSDGCTVNGLQAERLDERKISSKNSPQAISEIGRTPFAGIE